MLRTRPSHLLAVLIGLCSAALGGIIVAVSAATPAIADASFRPYPYGAPGDAGATDACPQGAYLVGLHASTGDWVNQLGITCAMVSPDGRSLGPDITLPMRGSRLGGTGDVGYKCDPNEVITSFRVAATVSKKQVAVVVLSCSSISGLARVHFIVAPAGVGDRNTKDILGVHFGSPYLNDQQCNAGEAGYAVAVRYGRDVNAVGLNCKPLAAFAPVMSNAGRPIRTTGKVSGPVMSNAGDPIRTTGKITAPPPDTSSSSSSIPPESTSPPVATLAAYAGIWAVTTTQNVQYEMILRVDGDALTGEFKNLQNPANDGTLTGRLFTDHASISWTQPGNLDSTGQPSHGTGTIKVHTDNTLGGGMTYKPPGAVRGSYYRWYGTLVRALPVAKHPANGAQYGQPQYQQPSGQQGQSGPAQPEYTQPPYRKPSGQQGPYGQAQPSFGQPQYQQPSGQQGPNGPSPPAYNQPQYQQPSGQDPNGQASPAYGQSQYQQPLGQDPNGQASPAYGQPQYQQPSRQDPNGQASPAYGQPLYQQPAGQEGPNGPSQPAYNQPRYQQPSGQDPSGLAPYQQPQ